MVTLYTRVWIEILTFNSTVFYPVVTLYTRVWIEILPITSRIVSSALSPSTRGCGLKSKAKTEDLILICHPLHEGVD